MRSIICPLKEAARNYPQQTAIIADEHNFNYAQFNHLVECFQTRLQNEGIAEGDYIAIADQNSITYVAALFALWRIGAVTCLISPRMPEGEITRLIQRFAIKQRLKTDELPLPENLTDHPDNEKNFYIKLEQDATLLFTSGSTGAPKAVLHSFSNHLFNAKGSNENVRIQPNDRWLMSLPLYHVSGLSILFRSVLGGGCFVMPRDQSTLAELVQKEHITHISLVPTQFKRLQETPEGQQALQQLKYILLGGATIPKAYIDWARKRQINLYLTYGLTETASQVATSLEPCGPAKVLKFREVRVSEQEILVRGSVLFKGYLQENSGIQPAIDDSGWYHTGDLGKFEDGYLSITGRKDNMFISGGENVYPEEVERALLTKTAVKRAVVVPVPDEQYGQTPIAFIHADSGLKREHLTDSLKSELPKFKIPKQFYRWPEEVSTDIPKVNRQQFLDIAQHRLNTQTPL